jgi:hypothetical protein
MTTRYEGYRDADGRTLFVKVRKEASETGTGKKAFYPVDAETGKPLKSLLAEWKTTPYNLPGILAAIDDGKWIIVVEGENKAEALIKIGLTATCLYQGAASKPGHFLDYAIPGSHWLIIPDCDTPGRKYARQVGDAIAGALGDIGECILWDINPKRSDKYDIYDWIQDKEKDGYYGEELANEVLQQAIDNGKQWAAPKPESTIKVSDFAPATSVADQNIPEHIKLVIDHATHNGIFHNGFLDALMRKANGKVSRLSERDLNTIWHTLPFTDESLKRAKASKDYFISILESEFCPSTNPVNDWLLGLSWDGGDHIAELATKLHTKHSPALVPSILRHWLAASIASITSEFIPQGMLILTGAQGIGKSTFLRHLCPPQLHDYYSETLPDLHNKDSFEALSDNFIINVSELASFQHADYNTLKGYLTLSKVKYRKAYGHYPISRPRRASFCGDTNDDRFLSDPTGNRRFWVIKLEPDNPLDDPIDELPPYCGDQVWAQALAQKDDILADNRGFIYEMLEHSEQFYQEPDILSAFLDLFDKPEGFASEIGIEYLSATEILAELHRVNPSIKGSAISLGKELARLGYDKAPPTRKNGEIKREWTVKRLPKKDVNARGDG